MEKRSTQATTKPRKGIRWKTSDHDAGHNPKCDPGDVQEDGLEGAEPYVAVLTTGRQHCEQNLR